MADFQLGDIVKLKSGSPKMTVAYIDTQRDGRTDISCVYFNEGKLVEVKIFADGLEKEK
ncbi:DUF2158 domain-containing protein [Algoriphagus resistens]|uniref:DUF2158 domain-containing protein n=1 Tax=Algoriphagus resistens TaxID=1750590 RepID=UPI0009EC93F1|nr:DUF2158 domain-containing protein [Algoriphagus resistens]